jgi:predicted short-subunit dehydrogenase-like oxidoreductase (DUF2520 family)
MILGLVKLFLGSDKDSSSYIINNYERLNERWNKTGANKKFDPILKNLLKTILSHKLFPIGGYFRKQYHTMVNVALEFMAVKAALMSRYYQQGGHLEESHVIDTIQPVTKRFYVRTEQEIFDYCKNVGWADENKLVTLVLNF